MTATRRQFLTAAAGLALATRPAAAVEPLTVTDMVGRKVHLAALPKRIVLLEGHDLLTMSLLHPDPATLVVGWAAADRLDSDVMRTQLLNGHPVTVVGKLSPDTISLEGLVGLNPDLVVATAFMAPDTGADSLVARLGRFGIPVIFSDGSSNAADETPDPFTQLKTSMRMWGALLGASEKAERFIAFNESEMNAVARRIAGTVPVTTYLEVQSTPDDCCWSAGRKIWGELLVSAGGQPLPAVTAPWFQKLSLEYVLSTPHDVYIASGGGWAAGGRPTIGPGIDPTLGRQGLRRLVDGRQGFQGLTSVKSQRVYGIWTGLITNLPLNLLFVAQVAKWLHPERCADLQPLAILDAINRDFAAFPIDGSLWVSI